MAFLISKRSFLLLQPTQRSYRFTSMRCSLPYFSDIKLWISTFRFILQLLQRRLRCNATCLERLPRGQRHFTGPISLYIDVG